MKRPVNKNYLWSKVFVDQLANLGVEYVCISPGSRSTSLTLAFARSSIKSFVILDERSSGFFALGLAKKTNNPVAVVTTSGTAVAELYPAVIEAYQQRVPLIVCTADRPPEMLNSGANQTINQNNIYANHINWFFDLGLPEVSRERISHLKSIALRAFVTSKIVNKGPVHLNFPFRKPFEPDSFTDEIEEKALEEYLVLFNEPPQNNTNFAGVEIPESVLNKIRDSKKTLIICGQDNYDKNFPELCSKLSKEMNLPVFADGASPLRFYAVLSDNTIANFASFLKSKNFIEVLDPELIIHFGNAPTSKTLLDFFRHSKAEKILVNRSGDWKDPSQTAKSLLPLDPSFFCEYLIENLQSGVNNSEYLDSIKELDRAVEELKIEKIDNAAFPFEGRIIVELLKTIPEGANLMVSNSLPIRDLDSFAPNTERSIKIFSNRGASGIDGIISTAAGIAAASRKPVILVTGDLAFYHDLNGLLALKHYKIPLTVVLINNNGGGIFEMLPVSGQKEHPDFFLTPLNLEFKNIVESYGGGFVNISSWDNFTEELEMAIAAGNLTVLEIKTDSKLSLELRKNFWDKTVKIVETLMNESSII